VLGTGDPQRLPTHHDLGTIRGDDARQDLVERALARPVGAEEGMDLPPLGRQGRAVERHDTAVALVDVTHLQVGHRRCSSPRGPGRALATTPGSTCGPPGRSGRSYWKNSATSSSERMTSIEYPSGS